jgi:hypothetical protein
MASGAPQPPRQLGGEGIPVAVVTASKKEYDAAHKRGDIGAAIKTKRAAKKQGVDVSGW